MDRPELELGISASPFSQGDDDVQQLVDRWVRQFEGDADGGLSTPPLTRTPARDVHTDDRSRSPLDTMRSNWSRRARGITSSDPEPGEEQVPQPKADAQPVKVSGLLTTFTDHIGGSISLAHVNGRLQHRGTVALRGRGASVGTACQDIGLPDHVTRAFEFVAAWFGFPLDAVNLRPPDDHVLSWGFWGFAGEEIARCLHEWKARAPEAFQAYCLAFGLDVLGGERDAPDEARRPTLSLQVDGRPILGRAAEWTIASEPRLMAVLARAGRDGIAQKMQIDLAVANWVTPIMFQAWDTAADGDRLTVDVLTSPRAIAALLYLVRRHGLRTATRLVRVVNERWRPQDDEDAWLAGVVRSLRHLNRDNDAGEVLRISSSPELAAE